jgi:hypothetical protein
MMANLARGVFLVFLGMMVVAYAVSVSKSTPHEPEAPTGRMYS